MRYLGAMTDSRTTLSDLTNLLQLAAAHHLPKFFEALSVVAKDWTKRDHVHIVLEDMLVRRYVRGSDVVHSLEADDAASSWICERLETLDMSRSESGPELKLPGGSRTQSYLGVPIVTDGLGRGALYIYGSDSDTEEVSEASLEALRLLAGAAALAISQRELVARADEHNRTMVRFALADPLTNLASQKHFDYMLKREWQRAQAEVLPLALLRLEIDAFEPHVGRIGPNQGRQTVRAVARLLDNALYRPSDLAARLEHDRFAVLLPDTDRAGAEAIAKRLVADTAALALPHPTLDGRTVTLSIGVAAHEPLKAESLIDDPKELTHLADSALEQAQTVGGNQMMTVE